MEINQGQRFAGNGATVDVHHVENGQVYFQYWPQGVQEQPALSNLMRMTVDDFALSIEGGKCEH